MKELNTSKINDNSNWKQFVRMKINSKTDLYKVYDKLIKWLAEFGKSIRSDEDTTCTEFTKEADKVLQKLTKIEEKYADLRKKMSSYDIGLWSLEDLKEVFEYSCSELKLFTTSPEVKVMLESMLAYGKLPQNSLTFTPSKMGDLHNFTDNSRKFVSSMNECIAIRKEKRSSDFALKHGRYTGTTSAMMDQVEMLKSNLKGSHTEFLKSISKGLVVIIDTFKRMDNKQTPNSRPDGDMMAKLEAVRLGLFILTTMRTKIKELLRNQKTFVKCVAENV